MKRTLCISLAVLLLASCSKEEFNEKVASYGPEFTASFENEETRTYVDGNLETRWTADDRISIFMTTYNAQYRFNGKTGDDSGTFSGDVLHRPLRRPSRPSRVRITGQLAQSPRRGAPE